VLISSTFNLIYILRTTHYKMQLLFFREKINNNRSPSERVRPIAKEDCRAIPGIRRTDSRRFGRATACIRTSSMLWLLFVLVLMTGSFTPTNSDASGCISAATSTGCQSGYINISSSVTSISSSAFNGYSITGVSFSGCNSITSLGSYSFANGKIATVVWPSTLKSIDVGGFYSNQLTSIDSSKLKSVSSLGSSTSFGVFQNNYISTVDLNYLNLTSTPANCFVNNQLHRYYHQPLTVLLALICLSN